jgi:hypothetical protein
MLLLLCCLAAAAAVVAASAASAAAAAASVTAAAAVLLTAGCRNHVQPAATMCNQAQRAPSMIPTCATTRRVPPRLPPPRARCCPPRARRYRHPPPHRRPLLSAPGAHVSSAPPLPLYLRVSSIPTRCGGPVPGRRVFHLRRLPTRGRRRPGSGPGQGSRTPSGVVTAAAGSLLNRLGKRSACRSSCSCRALAHRVQGEKFSGRTEGDTPGAKMGEMGAKGEIGR